MTTIRCHLAAAVVAVAATLYSQTGCRRIT